METVTPFLGQGGEEGEAGAHEAQADLKFTA